MANVSNLSTLVDAFKTKFGKTDDPAFNEIIKQDVLAAYATIIKRDYQKTGIFNHSLAQTIRCVPLRGYADSHCVSDPEITDKILRTAERIPRPLVIKDHIPFISITNTFLGMFSRKEIPIISPVRVEYQQHNRFTKSKPFGYYEDGFLYIINTKQLPSLSINGIFENPLEVLEYAGQTNSAKECACACGNCDECEDVDADCNSEDADECLSLEENYQLPLSYMMDITSFLGNQNALYQNAEYRDGEININKPPTG